MKRLINICRGSWVGICLALTVMGQARAELRVVPPANFPAVFGGGESRVDVMFHNAGGALAETELRTQLFQASSATVVALGEPKSWKKLAVLPGQTVLESVLLTFPAVNAETRFVVNWLDPDMKVVGATEVMVYPTNLLTALKVMAAGKALGIYDPQDQIKPLLQKLQIEFENLEDTGIAGFAGRLAVVGPPPALGPPSGELRRRVESLAFSGRAVVWINAEARTGPDLEPAMRVKGCGKGAVTFVRNRVMLNPAANPIAQLNLVRAAEMAIQPGNSGWQNEGW